MSKYTEQFLDPRWQKLRLFIMARDDFTCVECGSKEKTLHAHHLLYFSNRKPWEYHDDFLITLCGDCHKGLKDVDRFIVIFENIIRHICRTYRGIVRMWGVYHR